MKRWLKVVFFVFSALLFLTAEAKITYGAIGEKDLHASFQKHIAFNSSKDALVGYLKIFNDSTLDESSYFKVKEACRQFVKKKVSFVVVHLNNLGGDVFPTLKICNLLQQLDIESGIPVITWIDKYAVAAAALIPYASRYIVISDGACMGGHCPSKGQQIFLSSSDKVQAILSDEFAGLASFFGRNTLIAEAMVNPSMTLIKRGKEIISSNVDLDYHNMGRGEDSIMTSSGETLTLETDELLDLGIADFALSNDKELPLIQSKKTTFEECPIFEDSFLKQFSKARFLVPKSLFVDIFAFFTRPLVSSIMLYLLIVCFYMQLHSKKFNVYGYIGFSSLLVIMLISFSIHSFSLIETLVLFLGIVFFVIETFVIPGFGSIGTIGIIFMVIGLFSLLLPSIQRFSVFDFESFSMAANSLIERLIFLIITFLVSLLTIYLIRKFFPEKLTKLSKLALTKLQKIEEKGFFDEVVEEPLPSNGTVGLTHCTLRPIGKVVVGNTIYDAISQGEIEIHKHTEVIVTGKDKGRIVVKPKLETK